jgi:hypothetical protein
VDDVIRDKSFANSRSSADEGLENFDEEITDGRRKVRNYLHCGQFYGSLALIMSNVVLFRLQVL